MAVSSIPGICKLGEIPFFLKDFGFGPAIGFGLSFGKKKKKEEGK